MTAAQIRLMGILQRRGGEEEYWPLVNDWVRNTRGGNALALRNINRTIDALLRARQITIDNDGFVRTLNGGAK